ncbi:hypothetical protein [Rhodococcus tukisamuensis]|uniref:Secreted protein n=1 Tax=Rhodococcus tukisamuensis TaxID=168276 RepID=A0A1G6UK82_9NOCA|nr:hypothetical protein [Rhodococcus tukisamuensis]SDD40925.1 hypothetical protein SAMN05444580_104198 [Rhodococcus tukisamuensis]
MHRILRRIATLTVSAATATLVFTGTATAAPAPAPGSDLAGLLTQAGAQSPEGLAALQGILGAAGFLPGLPPLPEFGATKTQNFFYPAPTLGCGVAGNPLTVTVATAQAGPNFPIPPWIERGDLRFQALPGVLGIPKTSGLSVAWFNVNTLKGGFEPLDDALMTIPTMSKTVATGEGQVFAALFGSVDYLDGTNCMALPTVGSFTA